MGGNPGVFSGENSMELYYARFSVEDEIWPLVQSVTQPAFVDIHDCGKPSTTFVQATGPSSVGVLYPGDHLCCGQMSTFGIGELHSPLSGTIKIFLQLQFRQNTAC